MSNVTATTQSVENLPTVAKINEKNAAAEAAKTKKALKKNVMLDRANYVDNSAGQIAVILRRTEAKFKVSVAFKLGKKTQVGCKSTHESEEGARKVYEELKAKTVASGWKPAAKKSKNPFGAFDAESFPRPGQKPAEVQKKSK